MTIEGMFILTVLCGYVAAYYAGKSSAQKEQIEHMKNDSSGWEDEAKFWRNAFLPDVEAKRIDNLLNEDKL